MLPTPRFETKPVSWFRDGFNTRPIIRDDYFSGLVESIRENGILQPPGALEDGRKLWGNYRIAAGIEAGLKEILTAIFPANLAEGQAVALTLVENIQHKAQTDHQTYIGIKRLAEACPGLQRQEIARMIGKSAGMVTQYLSADSLCPDAMTAFRDGKLGITKVYKITQSPDQLATLAIFLNGGTRDEADKKAKAAKNATAQAVRTSKIKVPLVSGATVTVAGDEISLEEAIEAAAEAIKNMKAALSKGLNAKTAMNVWRDVAAAG